MTADSSGPTAAFLARLGSQVRRRRHAAGLTVQQLADAAELSRRMVTQIELGQANPSLVTVDKLARALDTDFPGLTGAGGAEPVVVQAPGTAAGVWASSAGSSATLVIASRRRPPAELWQWLLQPGDRYDAQPDPPGSEELFWVLAGTLTIELAEGRPVAVPEGASARLATDRQYAYVNHGATPLRFVRVVQLA